MKIIKKNTSITFVADSELKRYVRKRAYESEMTVSKYVYKIFTEAIKKEREGKQQPLLK